MLPPSSIVTTTLLFAGLSAAAAAQSPRSFSLDVEKKSSGSQHDFIRAWAAVHQKWGKGVSSEVYSMLSPGDDGDDGHVNVTPLGSDDIYVANIEIGSPPQSLKLALDTGSSDLWVQSTDTEYWSDPPHAPQYRPNASKTSRRIGDAEWAVNYVDGTMANGIVYSDTLRMGSFEIPNMAIQSAREIASRFEREERLSGILGLAKTLPSNIEPSTPTLLDKLRPLLDRPLFSVDLARNATGRFDFGHVDPRGRASGDISWVATNASSPHWDVTFELTAWKGSIRTWWYHSFEATIDTGTTLMFLPPVLAGMYWNDVPDMRIDPRLDNAFTFPCKFANNLPDLMFKLPETNHVLTIPGPYLNYGPVRGDDDGYCWGGMQSSEDLDVTILGDVMLKALYVVFDLETKKVGFANKKLDDVSGD